MVRRSSYLDVTIAVADEREIGTQQRNVNTLDMRISDGSKTEDTTFKPRQHDIPTPHKGMFVLPLQLSYASSLTGISMKGQ